MITKEELKDRICEVLSEVHGCKPAELVLKLDKEMLETLEVVDLSTVIAELVHDERIIEIVFIINEKSKSFLLPSGTVIKVTEVYDG